MHQSELLRHRMIKAELYRDEGIAELSGETGAVAASGRAPPDGWARGSARDTGEGGTAMSDAASPAERAPLERPAASPEGKSAPDAPSPAGPPARAWYRRPLFLVLAVWLGLAGLVVGFVYVRHAMTHESTDDAFIEAHVVAISPKVASFVSRVHVDDNVPVATGALLVELDPRDFEARLAQAKANLAAAAAEAARAQTDAQRFEALIKIDAVSRQDRDNAVAKSQTAAAAAEQARAAVRQAELDLSYTKIYAPEAGRVTRKNVEPGAYVQVGQALFSIVPDRVWVVANFKENQLRYMRPGQPARIKVDAYPDRTFRGHVDSIQAGAGARFSLLPPENATGNFVKVVQRVPVKILLDDAPDPHHVLGPGMSVVPEVKVR
jgi:membrane fusion protein (multidrug efflux system)